MYKIGLKLWSINTDYYLKEAERLFNDNLYDYIELYVVPDTLDTLEQWHRLNIPFIIHKPILHMDLIWQKRIRKNVIERYMSRPYALQIP